MSIHPIKNQLVQKYLSTAKTVLLSKNNPTHDTKDLIANLSKSEKILITKLIHNINVICKMPKKQVVEYLKSSPGYQQILGDLYFTSSINNYRLIVNQLPQKPEVIIKNGYKRSNAIFDDECYAIDYRIEFTMSNIGNKRVMKPVICLFFKLNQCQRNRDSQFSVYLSLDKFAELRYKTAEAMKTLYSVEMRTLY